MKVFEGKVISTNMQKTGVVSISRHVVHPLYKKRYKRDRRFKVDLGEFTPKVGDRVKITETKPLSKDKQFKIASIIEEKDI